MFWIAISWIAFSFLAGWLAGDKGRCGPCFFFLSLLLSPLIGVIAAAACQARTPDPAAVPAKGAYDKWIESRRVDLGEPPLDTSR